MSLLRGNPKGLQAKSSPECDEPEVAALLGNPPTNGETYTTKYIL
ncbi:hypothetical protein QFZ80_002730 [Paenibacillus sp. V4I7]|nr:hypothetical protein [Paenibacillus sp. V4I7]